MANQDTQLHERASELIKDADQFKDDLINEIEMMYKDLNKFNNKNVTASALRLRVRLMSFKKFADIARKDIQRRVNEIKEERKQSRAVAAEASEQQASEETVAAAATAQNAPKSKKKGRKKKA